MDRTMIDIKEMLCKELEDIANKGELSAGDLDAVYKLVVSKEKLLRIEELEEDLGYSNGGEWNASGNYGRNSYRGRKRDSMGRYSRYNDSKAMIVDQIESMMRDGNVSASDKMALQRAMDQLR